uniref:Uncharacterized protein n=1 Tax=Anguilla anguilla TaxID=7936 RepID=A0A0E9SJN4_ANGAN
MYVLLQTNAITSLYLLRVPPDLMSITLKWVVPVRARND